jgi:hypothetical protein
LENAYSEQDYTDVATDNDVYVSQTATNEYTIHQFKNYVSTIGATLTCKAKSNTAPSDSTVYLQIYNYDTPAWETVDSDNTTGADTEFTLEANVPDLTDYKDGNVITCRVYQLSP